jgi:threonine-phosphate decarboxylase
MQANATIILDESFLEFEELASYRDKIDEYKKLYIIQSFSKFYSCAGVRVGAIFSHKKSIKKLPQNLWNISSLDTEFLKKRLVDEEFITKSKELHKIQKTELIGILENSSHFSEIVESQTNFILTHTQKGTELFEHLLQHKILVRTCESFTYLDKNWLRFAVKSKEDQAKLKEALSAFS